MFKQDFKYYKSRHPPPSFEDVLDFNSPDLNRVAPIPPKNTKCNFFGLKPVHEWAIYEIIDKRGLILISNPFSSLGQRYWVTRCLKDYSAKPNKTNLDSQTILPQNVNWWNYSQNNINSNITKKLRWATLGYHHNWDTKVYTEDMRGEFPEDLGLLTNIFATALGFTNFKPQAAIVNYYYVESTLSGHTDHSEQNLEAPLFSFSFGQTALFLLGGCTIDTKPTAMFLHSGDVVVMSHDVRLAYHGVPRIMKNSIARWNECENWNSHVGIMKENLNICEDEALWVPFGKYLDYSRININVRQVLKDGQLKLE